jgi:hypothetical protein
MRAPPWPLLIIYLLKRRVNPASRREVEMANDANLPLSLGETGAFVSGTINKSRRTKKLMKWSNISALLAREAVKIPIVAALFRSRDAASKLLPARRRKE